MLRLWPLAVALCLALTSVAALPPPIKAQSTTLWSFAQPGATGGFGGQPSNGASNSVSWIGQDQFPYPPGGGLRIDYAGSRGFNTAVMTPSIPAASWNTVDTITADVYVPAQVTIGRVGFGLQVDGPPASKYDVPVHLMNVRGGWNHMSWPIHPGQLSGHHTFGFVLDTDLAMPAPLFIANLRAVQPHITVDAEKTVASINRATLWGNNLAYYYPPSFFSNPLNSQLAKDAGFTFFRIPGGLNSDVYHWNGNGVRLPNGAINPAARNPDGTWRIDYSGWAPGFEVKGEGIAGDPMATDQPNFSRANAYDHTPPVNVETMARWIMGLGPKAQMMVDVNVGTGSALMATGPGNTLQPSDVAAGAQEAAQWVKYFNQRQGLHVKYWEIGNELNPFGAEMGAHIRDSSPQGWHWITAADYATIFRTYAQAMKAVDPAIKVAGPVGYFNAPADGSGQGNWLRSFLNLAGDQVDVIDLHFYDAGRTAAEYLSVPPNLQTQVDTIRGWIQRYAPQRAGDIGIGISEWGDYNNRYPMGDGLFAADLMGQMAQDKLAFGNAWDIGNMIPDNGQIVPRFGFDAAAHLSGGWQSTPGASASNTISWTNDPAFTRAGGTSMVVDYRGSQGPNAALARVVSSAAGDSLLRAQPASSGIDWNGVNEIRADVYVPKVKGDDAIRLWLRIVNRDGSVDDSYRNQPQSTIWGHWNRILFPVDPTKLANARRLEIVVDSPIPIATPLYFGALETQRTLLQPNARYWAAYMYHHYFGKALLATSIGQVSRDRLAAYASRAADGSLYLMVINKDPESAVTIPISISGYKPAGAAEAYTWDGANYVWDATQGVATKDTPPTMKVVGAAGQFTYTFPKYSITSLHLYPG